MSVIIAGIDGPVWGVQSENYIVLNTIGEDWTSEATHFRGADTESRAVAVHSPSGTLEAEYAIQTPASAPARALIGHRFTPSDSTNFPNTYVVTGVSRSRRQGEWMSGRLTCVALDGITVTWSTTTD